MPTRSYFTKPYAIQRYVITDDAIHQTVAPLGSDHDPVLVFIVGKSCQRIASIGAIGQFGFDNQLTFGAGSLWTEVSIGAAGIRNPTNAAQTTTTNIIVDGSRFNMDISFDGSFNGYYLNLTPTVTDASVATLGRRTLDSEAEFRWENGSLISGSTDYDLGMCFDAVTNSIVVAETLQSLDLGVGFGDAEIVAVSLPPVRVPPPLPLLATGLAGLAPARAATG